MGTHSTLITDVLKVALSRKSSPRLIWLYYPYTSTLLAHPSQNGPPSPEPRRTRALRTRSPRSINRLSLKSIQSRSGGPGPYLPLPIEEKTRDDHPWAMVWFCLCPTAGFVCDLAWWRCTQPSLPTLSMSPYHVEALRDLFRSISPIPSTFERARVKIVLPLQSRVEPVL